MAEQPCSDLRTALARCEKAVSGRCAASSKACDVQRHKLERCLQDHAAAPPPTPPPSAPHTPGEHTCGLHHCATVDRAIGRAYTWATADAGNRFGQLGRGSKKDARLGELSRAAVELPASAGAVTKVAAGDNHTVFLTSSGKVFACGSDRWLQLGQAQFWKGGAVWQRTPQPVPALANERIVDIAAGADHTLALDGQGRVWAFGRGEHGQCLGESRKPFTVAPTPSAVLSSQAGGSGRVTERVFAKGHCSCAVDSQASCTFAGRCGRSEMETLAGLVGLLPERLVPS